MYFLPSCNQGQGHILAYILSLCNQAHIPPTYDQHTSCLCAEEKTSRLLVHMNKNRQLQEQLPSSQQVICPWASGACRSETFLSRDSLKHSHFKLVNIMFTITRASNDIPFSSAFPRNFCHKMILTFIKCPVCFYYKPDLLSFLR